MKKIIQITCLLLILGVGIPLSAKNAMPGNTAALLTNTTSLYAINLAIGCGACAETVID